MMLWYKAWRESRVRFLLSATVVTILCVSLMVRARTGFPPVERPDLPYSAWVWANIYGNLNPTLFVILAMVLGLGGMQRERTVGTAAFTLALPVTRFRLVIVRAGLGLLQVALLGLIPAMLVPTLSPVFAGQSYPETQALQFALLFQSWGALAFAVGFLWSSVFTGEFTGTALCVITPVAYRIVLQTNSALERFPAADYVSFMSARPYIRSPINVLIVEPLPWTILLVLGAVTIALIACSARIVHQQDF